MPTSDNAWDDPSNERAVDPKGQEPELDLGVVGSGNAGVDESLSALSDLDQRNVNDHPGVYEGMHEQLSQALSQFDDVEFDSEASVDS